MRPILLLAVLVLVIAGAAAVLLLRHAPAAAPPAPSVVPAAPAAATGAAGSAAPAASAAVNAAPASAPAARPLRVPPAFAGFETWSAERQLNAVTDIQRNPRLPPEVRDFLVDLAADPSRRSVLRNNAANALGIQDPPVAGWLGRLAEQAMDPAETATWRDYALQHLADQLAAQGAGAPAEGDFIGSPDSGLDRRRYLAVLTTVAASPQIVAGTALLHLDRLQRESGSGIDPAELTRLIVVALERDEVDIGAKVTAMGILGLRKDPRQAGIPRRFLADPRPDVRRAAVAALGHLGTAADIPAIAAVETGGDPLVEKAKQAAIARLTPPPEAAPRP